MESKEMKTSRTKILLWNVLCELLFDDKKDFDALTINDICSKAIVHRSTFYNHFADKYHLFQFGFKLSLNKCKEYPVEQRFFQPFSTIELANEQLNFPVLLHKFPVSLSKYVDHMLKNEMEDTLLKMMDHDYVIQVPVKVAIELLISAFSTLVIHVIEKEITAEEADRYFRIFIEKGIIKTPSE